jgi:hypothetical protein
MVFWVLKKDLLLWRFSLSIMFKSLVMALPVGLYMIRELWPIKRRSFDVINTEVLQCTPIVRYLGAIGEE